MTLPITKIATCCFCGSRTMLHMQAVGRHELACSSCGAPLHEMKALKVAEPAPAPAAQPKRVPTLQYTKPSKFFEKPKKRKSKKRRKPQLKKIFGELEDLFEDIFDIFD